VGVTFLQDREERINGLFADLKKAAPEGPDALPQQWNELTVLLPGVLERDRAKRSGWTSDETACPCSPRQTARVARGNAPIEWFEVIALLRAFAVEAIKDGRDKREDMKRS
jgi:hypothetical protein